MRVSWRPLLTGVLGSLVLLALWWRPTPVPLAEAQGVGIFSRATCTEVNSPVSGQTFCFNQTDNALTMWTGTQWVPVTLIASQTTQNQTVTINGQANVVTYALQFATSSGTNQQVGLWLDISGSNTIGAGNFRIPLVLTARTGAAAATADGIVGLNVAVTQGAADAVAFGSGIEVAFNNNKRNDPLNPVDQNHFGMTLDAYGGFSTGPAALAIRTAAVNSNWQRGLWIPVNSITPLTGYVIDYEGNGTGRTFRVSEAASVTIGNSLNFPTAAVLPIAGPAIFNNGSAAFTFVGGSSDTRWFSNNLGAELMRLFNSGSLIVGSGPSDQGAGTLNVASATYANGRPVIVATASGANVTSALGLSASSSRANNLRGSCTFGAASTCSVSFATNEIDAHYFIQVTQTSGTTFDAYRVSSKGRGGFTINASQSNSNSVDWVLIR